MIITIFGILLSTLFYISSDLYYNNVNYFSDSTSAIFTKADSLRGSIYPEREWWDVLKYDISVTPDPENKSIYGKNKILYKVISDNSNKRMQIDLQEPMQIDSILINSILNSDYQREGNVWYLNVPNQEISSENSLLIYFHGTPKESKFPPWDGGWVWKKDSLDRHFISVACQGLGASSWFPCKDHQSDEPDEGASMTITVNKDFKGISNGRLETETDNGDGTVTYKWSVKNPINSYCIVPSIGNYIKLNETYNGEKGKLDIELWVLDFNSERAKAHLFPEIKKMLEAFEYWLGPYPFYEDGYKIIDAPFAGMEHQSGIAYGNKYLMGYWGKDRSGTGRGMNWDYMIVHESGHEWFGNSITTNDIADMWVHEGFTDYSETLYIEYWHGKEAADEYNKGLRKVIFNKSPVIGYYGVGNEGSSDMYAKGSNLIHTIRHSIDDDVKFREMIRGINRTFFHKTVDSKQIEDYISENAGFDYKKVFDQYLRTIQIPEFEFYFNEENNTVKYRYVNCIDGFNLPLTLTGSDMKLKIYPTTEWSSTVMKGNESILFDTGAIENKYYLKAKETRKN